MGGIRFILRTIASTLLITFSSQILFADSTLIPSSALIQNAPQNWKIPSTYGRIKKIHHGTRSETILLIQDAHSQQQAQKNIAHLLDTLAASYGLNLIGLEGGAGELYPKLFSFIPDKKAKQEICRYFLEEGRLTGAEYLSIVKRPDLQLFGIENKALYSKNKNAYLSYLQGRKENTRLLEKLSDLLETISHHALSEELYRYSLARKSFLENPKLFVPYLQKLKSLGEKYGLNFQNYPNLQGILTLLEKKNSDNRENTFLSDPFLKEISLFEESIENKITLPQEKKLARLWKILEIYQKILQINLTEKEARFFYQNHSEFKISNFELLLKPLLQQYRFSANFPKELFKLDERLQQAESFYQLALERDEVLIANALKALEIKKSPLMAVITGGFHTPGIERYLEEKGFSFVVVVPQLSQEENPALQTERYEKALIEKPLPLQNFLEETYFKSSNSWNQTHLQLNPELLTPAHADLASILKGQTHPQTLSLLSWLLLSTLLNSRNPKTMIQSLKKSIPQDSEKELLREKMTAYEGWVYREFSSKDSKPKVQFLYEQESSQAVNVLIRFRQIRDANQALARWNSPFIRKEKIRLGDWTFQAMYHVPLHLIDDDILQDLQQTSKNRAESRVTENLNRTIIHDVHAEDLLSLIQPDELAIFQEDFNLGLPIRSFSFEGNSSKNLLDLKSEFKNTGIQNNSEKFLLSFVIHSIDKTEYRMVVGSGKILLKNLALLWQGPLLPEKNYAPFDFIMDFVRFKDLPAEKGRLVIHLGTLATRPSQHSSEILDSIYKNWSQNSRFPLLQQIWTGTIGTPRSEMRSLMLKPKKIPKRISVFKEMQRYFISHLDAENQRIQDLPESIRSIYLFHQSALRQIRRSVENLSDEELLYFDFEDLVTRVYWEPLKSLIDRLPDQKFKSWLSYRGLLEGLPKLTGLKKELRSRRKRLAPSLRSELRSSSTPNPYRKHAFEILEERTVLSGNFGATSATLESPNIPTPLVQEILPIAKQIQAQGLIQERTEKNLKIVLHYEDTEPIEETLLLRREAGNILIDLLKRIPQTAEDEFFQYHLKDPSLFDFKNSEIFPEEILQEHFVQGRHVETREIKIEYSKSFSNFVPSTEHSKVIESRPYSSLPRSPQNATSAAAPSQENKKQENVTGSGKNEARTESASPSPEPLGPAEESSDKPLAGKTPQLLELPLVNAETLEPSKTNTVQEIPENTPSQNSSHETQAPSAPHTPETPSNFKIAAEGSSWISFPKMITTTSWFILFSSSLSAFAAAGFPWMMTLGTLTVLGLSWMALTPVKKKSWEQNFMVAGLLALSLFTGPTSLSAQDSSPATAVQESEDLEKRNIGFEILAPMTGELDASPLLQKSKKNSSSTLIYVEAGEVLAKIHNGNLQNELKRIERLIEEAFLDYGRNSGFPLVSHPYFDAKIETWLLKNLPENIKNNLIAWHTQNGKLKNEQVAAYWKENRKVFMTKPTEIERGFGLFSLLIQKAELEKNNFETILAPENGFIKAESIHHHGNVPRGTPLFKMIPSDRPSTQIRLKALPDYPLFSTLDERDQESAADIVKIHNIVLLPENTPQILMNVDLHNKNPEAGIPQKIRQSINPRNLPLEPQTYPLEYPIQAVSFGRMGIRGKTSVHAPLWDGYWIPNSNFSDGSFVEPKDAVGSIQISEEVRSTLEAIQWLHPLSEQWLEDIKIQNRQDPKQLIKDGFSTPEHKTLLNWQAQANKFLQNAKLNTSFVSKRGVYYPDYWKAFQYVKQGEEIGISYDDHLFLSGVRFPKSVKIHPQDIVLIESSSGPKFLGEVRNIHYVLPNTAGQNLAEFIELDEIMVPDIHLALGDQEPVSISLPSPQEQSRLRRILKETLDQKPDSNQAAYPKSFVPSPLPASEAFSLLKKIRQESSQDISLAVQNILSASSLHERIRSMEYFLSHYQAEPNFENSLRKLILEGSPEVAQLGIELLEEKRSLLELLEVFDILYKKNPRSSESYFVYQTLRSLLEINPDNLSLLIQSASQDSVHRMLEDFFWVVFASEKNIDGLLPQTILRSSFWTNEDAFLKQFPEWELIRRLGYEQALHFREGFAPKSAKDKLFNVVSKEARDNIRRLELDDLDSAVLFAVSPQWRSWRHLIPSDLFKILDDNKHSISETTAPVLPQREAISQNFQNPNPIFSSKDFNGQKEMFRHLSERKKWRDLANLLRVQEFRKIHGNQIASILNQTPEGRLLLAEIYVDLRKDPFLNHLENSDFSEKIREDLLALKSKVDSLLFSEKPIADLKAPLDQLLRENTAAKINLLQRVLAKQVSATTDSSKRKIILDALMRSLISRHELSAFLQEKSKNLALKFISLSLHPEELKAAASEEAERRAWLFSILLLKEKYGFVVFDVVYPGAPHNQSVLIEQTLDPRRYAEQTIEERLGEALKLGKISQETYDELLENKTIFKNQILQNTHETLEKNRLIFHGSVATLGAVGFLVSIFVGSLFAIFIWPLLTRRRLALPTAEDDRLDQILMETHPDFSDQETFSGARSEVRRQPNLSWNYYLKGYVNFFTHRPILNAPDHLKYEGSDLRETFYEWAHLLKSSGLTTQDYIQILKLARKTLFEKKLAYSAEKLANIKSWNTEAEADLVQIWIDLLDRSLNRIAADAEKIKKSLRENREDYSKQKMEETLYEMGLWMDQELIPLKKAALSLRDLIGAADYLKFNFGYQKTLLRYSAHPLDWPFWVINRIAFIWFNTVRIFTSLSLMGFLSKKWFLDILADHLERTEKIAPHFHEARTLEKSSKIIHTAFFYQDNPQGRLGGAELDEWRKMFSRTLTVGSTFAVVGLFFVQFVLPKNYVIDYFGALASLGSFFAVLGLGIHNFQSIMRWWTSRAPLQSRLALTHYEKIARQLLKFGPNPSPLKKRGLFNQTPLLALAHARTLNALKKELDFNNSPSVDMIVVIVSAAGKQRQKMIREQLKPYLRSGTPLIVHLQDIPGAGGAYLSAHEYVKRHYDLIAASAHDARTSKSFEKARILYLLAGGESGDPLSLFQGSDKRILPETVEGLTLDTLVYALLNGYKASQNMKRSNKSGEIILATDGLYQGDLLPQGNVTLIGSFVSAREIIREGLGVLFDTFGKNLRDFLDHPTLHAVQKYVNRTRKRTRLYQHHDNLDLKQYAGFTGNVLLAFEPQEIYREAWDTRMEALSEVARIASQKNPKFSLDLAKDILIPQTVEDEMGWGTYLAYRTLRMPESLKDLYAHVLDIHQKFKNNLSIPHSPISHFVAPPSQSSFQDLRDPSTYFAAIRQNTEQAFQDPNGFIRIDEPRESLLFGFNGTPVQLPAPSKNILMAHLNFGQNGKSQEITYFQSLSENPFRNPNRFLGIESNLLIGRLRDSHGRAIFRDPNMNLLDVPLFPKGAFDPQKIDWLKSLPEETPIILPVEDRIDLEAHWVSLRWILEHSKDLNHSEISHSAPPRSEARKQNSFSSEEKNKAALIAAVASAEEMMIPSYETFLLKTVSELDQQSPKWRQDLPELLRESVAEKRFALEKFRKVSSPGIFIFRYNPELYSLAFLKALVGALPSKTQMILLLDTPSPNKIFHEKLLRIFSADIRKQKIEILDEFKEGWDFETFLKERLKKMGLEKNDLLFINDSSIPKVLLKNSSLMPLYQQALAYASEYAVLAGSFPTAPKGSTEIQLDQILSAVRFLQRSA